MGVSCFNGEGCFLDGGLHFYVGDASWGSIGFDGAFLKKIVGGVSPMPPPSMGNPVR